MPRHMEGLSRSSHPAGGRSKSEKLGVLMMRQLTTTPKRERGAPRGKHRRLSRREERKRGREEERERAKQRSLSSS
eukprot:3206315-Rhodomonas_salina.1